MAAMMNIVMVVVFRLDGVYAKEKLTQLNGTGEMSLMLADAFSPAEFIECEGLDEVLEHVNKYLVFDGYEIKTDGKKNMGH